MTSYKRQRPKDSKPRKTISVAHLRERINAKLAAVSNMSEREAVICILEDVLHCTNSYRGFTYLYQNEVPEGCNPGIIKTGTDDLGRPTFIFPDDTRRKYL